MRFQFTISLAVLAAALGMMSAAPVSAAEAPVQLSLVNPIQVIAEEDSIRGLRLNLIYGVNEDVYGVDLGMVNEVRRDFTGVQFGLVNLVDYSKGLQVGFYNQNYEAHGMQFGFVNVTDYLDGLQIGLLNFNRDESPFGFLPFVNYSF